MDFPFFLKRQIFNLSSHTVFLLREILLERSVYVSERIVWLWGKGAGMFVCVRGTTVFFFFFPVSYGKQNLDFPGNL